MVHVLENVLRKVGKSLRPNGTLLLIQPARENSIIKIEVDGKVKFSEESDEPNFLKYLDATTQSISTVTHGGVYRLESEETTPMCDEYDTVNKWIKKYKIFCEDLEWFEIFSEKIRDLVKGYEHKIFVHWKERKILLRK